MNWTYPTRYGISSKPVYESYAFKNSNFMKYPFIYKSLTYYYRKLLFKKSFYKRFFKNFNIFSDQFFYELKYDGTFKFYCRNILDSIITKPGKHRRDMKRARFLKGGRGFLMPKQRKRFSVVPNIYLTNSRINKKKKRFGKIKYFGKGKYFRNGKFNNKRKFYVNKKKSGNDKNRSFIKRSRGANKFWQGGKSKFIKKGGQSSKRRFSTYNRSVLNKKNVRKKTFVNKISKITGTKVFKKFSGIKNIKKKINTKKIAKISPFQFSLDYGFFSSKKYQFLFPRFFYPRNPWSLKFKQVLNIRIKKDMYEKYFTRNNKMLVAGQYVVNISQQRVFKFYVSKYIRNITMYFAKTDQFLFKLVLKAYKFIPSYKKSINYIFFIIVKYFSKFFNNPQKILDNYFFYMLFRFICYNELHFFFGNRRTIIGDKVVSRSFVNYFFTVKNNTKFFNYIFSLVKIQEFIKFNIKQFKLNNIQSDFKVKIFYKNIFNELRYIFRSLNPNSITGFSNFFKIIGCKFRDLYRDINSYVYKNIFCSSTKKHQAKVSYINKYTKKRLRQKNYINKTDRAYYKNNVVYINKQKFKYYFLHLKIQKYKMFRFKKFGVFSKFLVKLFFYCIYIYRMVNKGFKVCCNLINDINKNNFKCRGFKSSTYIINRLLKTNRIIVNNQYRQQSNIYYKDRGNKISSCFYFNNNRPYSRSKNKRFIRKRGGRLKGKNKRFIRKRGGRLKGKNKRFRCLRQFRRFRFIYRRFRFIYRRFRLSYRSFFQFYYYFVQRPFHRFLVKFRIYLFKFYKRLIRLRSQLIRFHRFLVKFRIYLFKFYKRLIRLRSQFIKFYQYFNIPCNNSRFHCFYVFFLKLCSNFCHFYRRFRQFNRRFYRFKRRFRKLRNRLYRFSCRFFYCYSRRFRKLRNRFYRFNRRFYRFNRRFRKLRNRLYRFSRRRQLYQLRYRNHRKQAFITSIRAKLKRKRSRNWRNKFSVRSKMLKFFKVFVKLILSDGLVSRIGKEVFNQKSLQSKYRRGNYHKFVKSCLTKIYARFNKDFFHAIPINFVFFLINCLENKDNFQVLKQNQGFKGSRFIKIFSKQYCSKYDIGKYQDFIKGRSFNKRKISGFVGGASSLVRKTIKKLFKIGGGRKWDFKSTRPIVNNNLPRYNYINQDPQRRNLRKLQNFKMDPNGGGNFIFFNQVLKFFRSWDKNIFKPVKIIRNLWQRQRNTEKQKWVRLYFKFFSFSLSSSGTPLINNKIFKDFKFLIYNRTKSFSIHWIANFIKRKLIASKRQDTNVQFFANKIFSFMQKNRHILGIRARFSGQFKKTKRATHMVRQAGRVAFSTYFMPSDFSIITNIMKYGKATVKLQVSWKPKSILNSKKYIKSQVLNKFSSLTIFSFNRPGIKFKSSYNYKFFAFYKRYNKKLEKRAIYYVNLFIIKSSYDI